MDAAADLPPADALKPRGREPDDLEARFDAGKRADCAAATMQARWNICWRSCVRDRAFRDDIGRKTMLSVFDLAAHQPELVSQWRRKLSASLLTDARAELQAVSDSR